ncbi:unnamed protein product [Victoria cruziana]
MHGRRSLEPELLPFKPEIDRLCRDIRSRLSLEMGSQLPMGGQVPAVEEPPRLLREFFISKRYDRGAGGMGPQIAANHYEIKASTINMLPSFHGLENEDPYRHLEYLCYQKAKHWFKSLPSSVRIATWDDLQSEFLKKYFPIGKTNHFRRAITTFSALEGETFHQAWERMKELLRRCAHHQIPRCQILQGFYDGLTEAHRQTIDSSCGGSLMLKSEEDAWMLFDTLSKNSLHSTGSSTLRQQAGKRGVLDIGTSPHVQTQLDSLSRKMDQLLSRGTSSSKPVCGLCDGVGHVTDDCPISRGVDAPAGQVNAVQGFSRPGYDPYSTSYNPGWRNHPNFGWRNTGPQSQIQSSVPPQRQTTYSQPSGF